MAQGGDRTAPWYLTMQYWSIGVVLALAGWAWHDTLRGRFPLAPRVALAALSVLALALAAANARVEWLALAFASAPALGWSLRFPRADERPLHAGWDVAAGLAFTALVAWVAFAWSKDFRNRAFVALLVLLVARIALVDPALAWWARRREARARL